MRARPRVILRVTNVSPRIGDSWLNRMPLQAIEPVRLAVVDRDPIGVDLRGRVRRARMERRRFALRRLGDLAEHLRARRLIEPRARRPRPQIRIASSSRSVPSASEFAVYSAVSNDTATWLCAARL